MTMADLNNENAVWVAMYEGYDDGSDLLGAWDDMDAALEGSSELPDWVNDSLEIIPLPIGGGTFDTVGGKHLWTVWEKRLKPNEFYTNRERVLDAISLRNALSGGNPRYDNWGTETKPCMLFVVNVLAVTEGEALTIAKELYDKTPKPERKYEDE
jgi:hypothetical protein